MGNRRGDYMFDFIQNYIEYILYKIKHIKGYKSNNVKLNS
ncbi:hypothetical protein QSQ_0669 [Clostridioides difficile P32]|nr:hypothetical protein QAW_0675 [Clostridioides difficile CD17]EQE65095.1 hypothetical protein QCM_0641 [Clostridioides difficile CD46]EQH42984.1 hypothetical protein QMA_0714 [Clostridioides difficile DA00244]EQJ19372.1 hypothetical protein QS3_0726 [Clostridioides difficile P13]EQJ49603.1 hypothetical protein QSG_0710 [Clostridioides difficile P25]EQJ51689.1 hypothetical protein QSE_0686 [Clostridioides difficile P24]EQJ62381.1 hypothetical protein QSQ_0669 [Clostridioides difficile P32]E